MTFDEIVKIVELLISITGVVLVVVGLILPFKQSIELNHKWVHSPMLAS